MPEVKMDRNEFFSRWSPSFTQEDKSDAKAFEADLDALLQSERDNTREECAKIAEDTPLGILRSQSHDGLRLSISQAIRKGGAR